MPGLNGCYKSYMNSQSLSYSSNRSSKQIQKICAMVYFTTVASICMVFTMFPFALFSMNIKLEIYNTPDSSTDVACGSKIVFMCSLSTAPKIFVEWLLDGSTVSSCHAGTCTQTSGTLSHYTFTQDSDRTKYHLTIDPSTFNDSKSFVCQDDDIVKSNTIKTNVVARYSKDNSTIAKAEDNTTVTVVVTTNCMSSPMTVVPKLQYKKYGSNNASYVDFPYSTPIVNYLECTNDDNPYCGGNVTMRGNTTLNIQKSYSGVLYTFLLSVEENGTRLVQQHIGSFRIKDIAVTTPSMDEENTSNSSVVELVIGIGIGIGIGTLTLTVVAVLVVRLVIVRHSKCFHLKDYLMYRVFRGKRRHKPVKMKENTDRVQTRDIGQEQFRMYSFEKKGNSFRTTVVINQCREQ